MEDFNNKFSSQIRNHESLTQSLRHIEEELNFIEFKLKRGDNNFHICDECLKEGKYNIIPKNQTFCKRCDDDMNFIMKNFEVVKRNRKANN